MNSQAYTFIMVLMCVYFCLWIILVQMFRGFNWFGNWLRFCLLFVSLISMKSLPIWMQCQFVCQILCILNEFSPPFCIANVNIAAKANPHRIISKMPYDVLLTVEIYLYTYIYVLFFKFQTDGSIYITQRLFWYVSTTQNLFTTLSFAALFIIIM